MSLHIDLGNCKSNYTTAPVAAFKLCKPIFENSKLVYIFAVYQIDII